MVSPELKLVGASAGLYSSFLYWGYLQEKITGKDYVSPQDESITGRWHFSFVLNGTKVLLPHFQACGARRDIEMLACGVHQRYVVHSLHIGGNSGVTGSLKCFPEMNEHVCGLNVD